MLCLINLFFLVVRSSFGEDVLLPAIVGGVVFVWIINSFLKTWGYNFF